MKTRKYDYPQHYVCIEASFFCQEDGVEEIHACAHVTDTFLIYTRQLEELAAAVHLFLQEEKITGSRVVLKRYFLSDAANQCEALQAMESNGEDALSIVQQPPLDGSKVAVWLYLQRGKVNDAYVHHWWANQYTPKGDSEEQMSHLFGNYQQELERHSMNVAQHCLRTWLFVHDIDTNYAGVVKARNDCFDGWGLTPQTHYITSTGIQGRQSSAEVKVSMDAYAVQGLRKEQIKYLYAPTHLSPTHIYGVAFERGVCVEYGDRKQIYISGTASIDCNGKVVHVGNVARQTMRMWENVEKLLEEGGATSADMAQAVVYLRDFSDYPVVRSLLGGKMPGVPVHYVHAHVCRSAWLIEMECIAILPNHNLKYLNF